MFLNLVHIMSNGTTSAPANCGALNFSVLYVVCTSMCRPHKAYRIYQYGWTVTI